MTAKKTTAKKTTKKTEERTDMVTMTDLDNALKPLTERLDVLEGNAKSFCNVAAHVEKLEKRLDEMPVVTQQTADELREQAQALRETIERIEAGAVEGTSADSMPIAQHAATVVDVVDEVRRRATEPGTDSRTRRMEARRTNRHNR